MSERIKDSAHFIHILKQEGWTSFKGNADYYLLCPFDKTIHCQTWVREFWKEIPLARKNRYGQKSECRKLGTISNFRDVPWIYNKEAGLIDNGLVAIRVR